MLEKRNHRYNKTLHLPDTAVSGQALGETGKMQFGLRRVASVGSGVIAVYNLLVLLEREANLPDVCAELYKKAAFPGGLFGVRPMRIIRYFAAHYIPVTLDNSHKDFCMKFKRSNFGIVIFWSGKRFFSTIHCVTVENHGDRVSVYNRFKDRSIVYEFKNIYELTDSKNFIVGYFI